MIEKYGVTENIQSLIDYCDDIVTSFLCAIEGAAGLNTLRARFPYINLRENIEMIDNSDIKICRLWFNIDPAKNTTSWLSDKTFISVEALEQKNMSRRLSPDYPNGIFSEHFITPDSSTPSVEGAVYIYLQKEASTLGCYRMGNYMVDIYDHQPFLSFLRHEFNHIHKETDYRFNDSRVSANESSTGALWYKLRRIF